MSAAPPPAEILDRYARVLVHVGLNLRPGQPVVVTDPYELQGIPPGCDAAVAAVRTAVREIGGGPVDVLPADPDRLRRAAMRWPDAEYADELSARADRLSGAVRDGAALLFLESVAPRLLDGLLPFRTAGLRAHCRAAFARVSPRLIAGATQWCVAPLPTADWADAVFPETPAAGRTGELWRTVAAALRLDAPDPLAAWESHLAALEHRRAALQARRPARVRFRGAGTDLVVALPPAHRWCTAQLAAPDGRRFVPNLPTEEIFTAPLAAAAEGTLRVARPVAVDGRVVEDIALEFHRGEIVAASAGHGADVLEQALATDAGALRLGEVAWVPAPNALTHARRCFLHPLLDENALPHVALGDSYRFTAADVPGEDVNHSALHLDLPVDAAVEFE